MASLRGIDEMEESWQEIAPAQASGSSDNVFATGEQAYLRTQRTLDEATAVSDMLFDNDADMARRRQRVYAREDALDAAATRAWRLTISPSPPFGNAPISAGPGNGSGAGVGGFGDITLAPGPGGGLGTEAAAERRPEERRCCDAFLKLKDLLQTLAPGTRVRPLQIAPILHELNALSGDAQNVASKSTARLRELQGSTSPDVAVVAAASHELSLERDTWELLLYLNEAENIDMTIAAAIRDDPSLVDPAGYNDSDEKVLELMWRRDPLYRRTHAVVKWLQKAADTRLEGRLSAALADGESQAGWSCAPGWSCTLESLAAGGGQKSEVAQMHPDANLKKVAQRGGGGRGSGGGRGVAGGGGGDALSVLNLVGQDDLDEEQLVREMWLLVRAGKVKSAKALCFKEGQPWRVAAMSGGGVVGTRDEDHGVDDGAIYSPGQGLWQDMCWQLSDSLERALEMSEGPARSVAKHEAALFAHLAGNSELLLKSELMQSWEDQAWARFCSLLHRKVLDERVRHRHVQASLSSRFPGVPSLRTDEQLLERMERTNPPSSHEAVFEVLDDSSDHRVRAEGKGVYRQAQQALILGETNIPLFLENILRRIADCDAVEDDHNWTRQGREGEPPEMLAPPPPQPFRSPQLLRFAAHLALILAAQCPYLTRADRTQEAIEDVVCAYAEHLANTQQISLVAVYAATLPISRRRELYARFLRVVEGESDRREALEQAKKHMASDVPAILRKVVEYARLETPSVAPRMPRQVPEGDLEKIRATSWLLTEPGTHAEAVIQANALARHLVLQKYQASAIGRTFGPGSASGLPWNGPPQGGSNDAEAAATADDEVVGTPVVLSVRAEAIEILLKSVPLARSSGPAGVGVREDGQGDTDEISESPAGAGAGAAVVENGTGGVETMSTGVVDVSPHVAREQLSWRLFLEARDRYSKWASTRRAQEQRRGRRVAGRGRALGVEEEEEEERTWAMVEASDADINEDVDAAAVQSAAEKAVEAAERVLTFEDGWMYPEDPHTTSSAATPVMPSQISRDPMDTQGDTDNAFDGGKTENSYALMVTDGDRARDGNASPGLGGGVVTYPLPAEEETDLELEENRKASEVAEARKRRVTREVERVAKEEEAAVRLGENARREELLSVRKACLPGLVFLFHEVVHSTGLWMLEWGTVDAAREWFVRGQTLANVVANDVHRVADAMSSGQIRNLLQCVALSTTKVLECDEKRSKT